MKDDEKCFLRKIVIGNCNMYGDPKVAPPKDCSYEILIVIIFIRELTFNCIYYFPRKMIKTVSSL